MKLFKWLLILVFFLSCGDYHYVTRRADVVIYKNRARVTNPYGAETVLGKDTIVPIQLIYKRRIRN